MVQDEISVESLVASGGSVVTVHPVLGGALRIRLLYGSVVLIYSPVPGAFKQVYVTIGPCKRSINVAGGPMEEFFSRSGI